MTVIYIDRVFFLNTIIDYLLLLTTAQIMGVALKRLRFILTAVIGGLYAVFVFLLPWLQFPLCRIAAGVLLTIIAFWSEPLPWRCTALFFILSDALAGVLLAIGLLTGSGSQLIQRVYTANISWGVLIGSTLTFYILLEVLFRQKTRFGRGELMEVKISLHGKTCCLRALYDTGNTLRNPMDGTNVLVAESEALRSLWTPEIREILQEKLTPEEKLTRLYQMGNSSFSLLPFYGIGEDHGLMLSVRSDYIQIGGRICPKTMIALCPKAIGGSAYHALWGGKEWGDATDQANTDLDTVSSAG